MLDGGALVQGNTQELVQVDQCAQVLGLVVQKRVVDQLIRGGLRVHFKRKTFTQKVLAVGTKILYNLLVNNNIVFGNELAYNGVKNVVGVFFKVLNRMDETTELSVRTLQKRRKLGFEA